MGSLSSLFSLGTPDLKQVETIIRNCIRSEAPLLHTISTYLLDLGGKRIRPILTLEVGQALGMQEPFKDYKSGLALLEVAAGIELIHMATLLHDDIIDKSPLRRHKKSPFIEFGLDNTLLTGDFLLVRAFGLCARLDQFIIDATEKACVSLTEGEILEKSLVEETHDLESSLSIARKKTASLFKLGAISAAHLAEVPENVVHHLGKFGECLGIAFQILDDMLDVTSDEDLLGKKSGQDLRERKPSVVNVLWLASGSALAKNLLTPPSHNEEEFLKDALNELRSSKVVEETKNLAREYAAQAQSALDRSFEQEGGVVLNHDQSSKHKLTSLIQYVVERAS